VLLAVPIVIGVLLVILVRLVSREFEERRHAERVLRESEAVFRQLADNVREVFYVCEWPAGGLIFVSPAFFRVFDRPAGEAFSFREDWIDSIDDEDRSRVREAWRAAAAGPFDVEYRIHRRDGATIWIHDRAFPVRDRSGTVVRIAGVAEDVTDARAAQLQLARHRDALEVANRELAQSNAELEEFASVASHDLQEPLRKIIAFTGLLREDLPASLPARAEEDASFIVDAAMRMRALVKDLLALSRTGTTGMTKQPLLLEQCVKRVLEVLDLEIAESGAVITHDPLPEVTGDPTLVEALYQNLLTNALKFTRPGESPRIHLSVEALPGGPTVLGVRDEGIGIDPAGVEEIFRPFRRLHARERYAGTGIGLAIAMKAVARHGGRLWVESSPGEGAHFRFTLAPERETAS
jgi:PAS domain S-box-containing protein